MSGEPYKVTAWARPQQRAIRYWFKSCNTNELGRSGAQYHRPLPAIDSNSELDKLAIQSMALEISKDYRCFDISPAIYRLPREDATAYLAPNSKSFEVISDADWNSQDGQKFFLLWDWQL